MTLGGGELGKKKKTKAGGTPRKPRSSTDRRGLWSIEGAVAIATGPVRARSTGTLNEKEEAWVEATGLGGFSS